MPSMSAPIPAPFPLPESLANPWSRWSGPRISGKVRRGFAGGNNTELFRVYGTAPFLPGFGVASRCDRPCNIDYMLRPIVLYGAEVLAKPSKPVTNISDAEVQLVKDMVETMYKAPGVGLAAPQVGVGSESW